jgi:hypothetical protein
MSLIKIVWGSALVLFLCVLAVGCGGGAGPAGSPQSIKLKQIHILYERYIKNHQKPPHQLSDLASKQYEPIYPAAVEDLKKGRVIVVWDVQGNDAGTVLAYEKEVPTQGGGVLMADGTIRQMSADELKAAIPAKQKN